MKSFLHLAYVTFVAVGVAGRYLRDPFEKAVHSDSPNHGASKDHSFVKRATGRSLCALSMIKAMQKRGIDGHELESNDTLVARDMILPTGTNIEQWIMWETADDLPGFPPRRLHSRNFVIGQDVNTAKFQSLEKEPFSINMAGLGGCTGMVILSKRGIYISHYWENIAFSQDTKTPPQYRYESQAIAFAQSVTRGLTRGIHRPGEPLEQDSLAANAAAIDDASIRGILMIPRTGPSAPGEAPKDDPYRHYWDLMKTNVGKILPRLDPKKQPSLWTEYRYHPRQDEEVIRDFSSVPPTIIFDPCLHTSRGRMLFKYDPDHKGKKKTLLYCEMEKQEELSWEW